MKRNASELSTERVLAPFKLDFLLLVMQLVVLCEDLSSRATSARADRLERVFLEQKDAGGQIESEK
jgi:hypothetical protein